MEWNPQTLQFLSECFVHALSPAAEARRRAESSLAAAADSPNYGLVVLRLASEPSIEDHLREAAAVNFKNHLRARWAPSKDNTFSPIPEAERKQIKSMIVPLMLSASPKKIQSQLSEALVVICKHEFPRRWPEVLLELISNLQKASQASDYASINCILGTVNNIFKKKIRYALYEFATPLLQIFLKTASLIDAAAAVAANIGHLFESQRLCCLISYWLIFFDTSEVRDDHMKEWMTEFRKYLTTSYSPPLDCSLVNDLRNAVCWNIILLVENNGDMFRPYVNDFVLAVWTLLGNWSHSSSHDDTLAITAIKFLTAVVSTGVHHTLFAGEGFVPQICHCIVIPNVRLRKDEEELFEMNYTEFIKRDINNNNNNDNFKMEKMLFNEGSYFDTTRRTIACVLLKQIARHFGDTVRSTVSAQIQTLLSSFAANPAVNWKDKHCAIYLVASLVSTKLVDVQSFFESVIVPELQSSDVNGYPMLKAGALNFFTLLPNYLPKHVALKFLPDLVRFLASESNVVQSYAAICIGKLLNMGGRRCYAAADINPIFPMLMNNLFSALKLQESEGNPYVMNCIKRVLWVADLSAEVARFCIERLTFMLGEVCKNPKNPEINGYLSDSIGILVMRACERDLSLVSVFEATLLPRLQIILTNYVTEFSPYAFPLLAQLVVLNKTPIPAVYMQIFEIVFSPDYLKRGPNAPALVFLLQAFLQKAPNEINQGDRLAKVLGSFDTLVQSSSTSEQGFYMLGTVVRCFEYDVIKPYTPHIWVALFRELQRRPTEIELIKSLLIFMSFFLIKYGVSNLVDTMHCVQPDIFNVILSQFWIPYLSTTGAMRRKLTVVASTRLICESPILLHPAAAECWGKMVDSIVALLTRPVLDRGEEEPDMINITEMVGYPATHFRLRAAWKKKDPLKDIRDPREFFVASLSRISTLSPGRYPKVIKEFVDPKNQSALLQFCNTYNLAIV